ncbi:MAG TPA: hypothetical protein VFY65_18590 [Longimicrobium sp.]|nr:hypothetical protein [Longimicrobium sp.]
MRPNPARALTARSATCVALCCIATACKPPDARTRDTAQPPGAAAASAAADSATWTLGAPQVRIGEGGGDGQELDRVYGGVIGPDGSVVIGNAGTGELRFYDPRGALRMAGGRRGMGPGEFQSINWLRPFRGDSLVVFDLQTQRLSVWSGDGVFARVIPTNSVPGHVRPIGVFGDGSMLLAADQPYDPRTGPGVVRDAFELLRVDASGAPLGSLGRFPGTEWLLYRHPTSFAAAQVPFGRTRHVAAGAGHVFVAPSDSAVVAVHDLSGRILRTISISAAPRRPRRDEVEDALARIPDETQRDALREHLASRRGRARAPVILDLRTDRAGRVWVCTLASAPDRHRWLVFAPSGTQEGSIVMPAGYLPLDIDRDRVLARETGADGVQRVVLHDMRP